MPINLISAKSSELQAEAGNLSSTKGLFCIAEDAIDVIHKHNQGHGYEL